MPDKKTLKNYLIKTILVALVTCAGVGIFVMLTQSFGAIQAKILGSTLAIGIFSITSLANIRNLESQNSSYKIFARLSISFSLLALLFILSAIWISITETPWKPTLVFTILAISTAHASLLLSDRSKSQMLDIAVTITIVSIAFVAGFIIYLILAEADNIGEFFYRFLGVFAILDILGTITVPIMARIVSKNKEQPAPESTSQPDAILNNSQDQNKSKNVQT